MDSFLEIFLVIVGATAVWSDNVPVLMWTSDGSSVSFPPAYAGHHLTGAAFSRDYLDRILEVESISNVVIFIEDQLTIEDMRDGVDRKTKSDKNTRQYTGLKNAMDVSMSATALPAVTAAVDEIYKTIVEFWTGPVHVLPSPSFKLPPSTGSDQDAGKSSLYIVKLPMLNNDTSDESGDVVDLVINQLEQSAKPFIGLYTSQRSSQNKVDRQGAVIDGAGRRQLLEIDSLDSGTYLFVNISNCLYVYVENITFTTKEESWNLPLNPDISDSSYCYNMTASLTLDYKDVSNTLPMFSMTMIFAQTTGYNAGYWYMSNFSVSYEYVNGSNSKNETLDIFPYFITETPFGLSYSCSYLPTIPPLNVTQTGRGVNITFHKLQVQAFEIYDDQFGRYNDCVGFFSIPVWTMVIVMAVLTIILADGVCMLMSINTTDRVDDPKGKTITINASD